MVIKCKMCGGDLVMEEGASIGTCEYCGSTMTVPSIDDEKLANLYNRANHFRMKSEFDKAAVSYENIIAEDENSAEAYWGLCLCKYGIEYVDDPVTEEKKPTCHRTQFTSILEDSDYRQAYEKADSVARRFYEREAQEIDRIQKQILEISSHEEPFDIFICYKESDENGNRTKDSVIAQDLYDALEDEGYKVFFARITLEDKLGTAYEPYIFAALNSAKVMIVVGTKPEHMNAVWVKNEWSRFLDMIRQGQKKMLIPAYRDMDPYDMPEQFVNLQAQDMSKIGFMQDLIRGIGKILNKGKTAKEPVREPVIVQGDFGGNAAALVKRGNMALEDREWERADGFFEQALNADAECGEAYFGKLLASLECSNMEEFAEQRTENIKNVEGKIKGACGIETARINNIVKKYTIENYLSEEEIRRMCYFELTYSSTVDAWEKQYKDVKRYYSANKLLNRTMRFAAGDFQTRLQDMCNKIDTIMEKHIAEAKKDEEETVAKIASEYQKHLDDVELKIEEKSRQAKVLLENDYVNACLLKDRADTTEEYERAGNRFKRIGTYKDSREQAEECARRAEEICLGNYVLACNAKKYADTIEKWIEAARLYRICGDYLDSVKCAKECEDTAENLKEQMYFQANACMRVKTIEQYEKAEKIFQTIREYKDSTELEKSCRVQIENMLQKKYNHAIQEMNTASTVGGYNWVKMSFKELGNYKDSEKMVLKCQDMITALQKEEQIRFEAQLKRRRLLLRLTLVGSVGIVIALLINIKLLKPMRYYEQAEELLEFGNVTAARMYFYRAGNYKDAKERADMLSANDNSIAAVYGEKGIAGIKGDGTIIKLGVEDLKMEEWKNITAISAGYEYFVGLQRDGRVVATGNNNDGQCDVEGWKDIVAVSTGHYHTVGLKSNGTVAAVGNNNDGQCDVEGWKDIIAVSAGHYHTVGLKGDGTVVAVGYNDYGQCGVEQWEGIIAVSAGHYHTVGLKGDGTVVAAGINSHGQCGVERWEDIIAVSAGHYHTVGLKSDGTVMATGINNYGQCDVQKWKNIVQVYAFETCTLGLKRNGKVVAAGNNKNGILSKVRKWTGIKVN